MGILYNYPGRTSERRVSERSHGNASSCRDGVFPGRMMHTQPAGPLGVPEYYRHDRERIIQRTLLLSTQALLVQILEGVFKERDSNTWAFL